jgi:hypothetical protein
VLRIKNKITRCLVAINRRATSTVFWEGEIHNPCIGRPIDMAERLFNGA